MDYLQSKYVGVGRMQELQEVQEVQGVQEVQEVQEDQGVKEVQGVQGSGTSPSCYCLVRYCVCGDPPPSITLPSSLTSSQPPGLHLTPSSSWSGTFQSRSAWWRILLFSWPAYKHPEQGAGKYLKTRVFPFIYMTLTRNLRKCDWESSLENCLTKYKIRSIRKRTRSSAMSFENKMEMTNLISTMWQYTVCLSTIRKRNVSWRYCTGNPSVISEFKNLLVMGPALPWTPIMTWRFLKVIYGLNTYFFVSHRN